MTDIRVEESSFPTIPDDPSPGGMRKEKRLRRGGLGFLLAVVVLAAAGLLGVRTASVGAESAALEVSVSYPAITRPGLAGSLLVTVRGVDGTLPDTLMVRLETAYLELFNEHSLSPTPADSFTTEQWTWWTFHPPSDAEELLVAFDARVSPSVRGWRDGSVSVSTAQAGASGVPAVEFRTWVLP